MPLLRFFLLLLLLPVLTGCGNSSSIEADAVYDIMFQVNSGSDLNDRSVIGVSYGEFYEECAVRDGRPDEISFTSYSADGIEVASTSFVLPDEAVNVPAGYHGDSGIYLIRSDFAPAPFFFDHYTDDGTLIASVPMEDLRPDMVTSQYPGESALSYQQRIPMAETDEGIVLLWGSTLMFLSEDLKILSETELPGSRASIWNDGGLRAVYIKNSVPMTASVTKDGVTGEKEMPGRFSPNNVHVIGVRDGMIYAYDSAGVFRWHIDRSHKDEPEEICTFTLSGINGMQTRRIIPLFREGSEYPDLYVFHDEYKDYLHSWLKRSGTVTDGDITVITIAAPQLDRNLPQLVIDFNKNNPGIRAVLLDYSVYNSAENPDGGWKKLRMDLETGLLKPDIIASMSTYTGEFLSGMDGYFTDLTALMEQYPDYGVTEDNIWNAVLTAYSNDGKLLALPKSFHIRTLVGLRKHLPDGESWNLENYLDYAESLPEGVYPADALSRGELDNVLGLFQYDSFTAAKNFDNALYRRYLDYKKSLPKSASSLIDRQTAYDPLLGIQVDVTVDPNVIYRNGSARLRSVGISGPAQVLMLLEQYGVTSAEELYFIGYPTDNPGHHSVRSSECVYMIPEHCEKREEAWKFVAGAAVSQEIVTRQGISVLKQETMDYLNTLSVTETTDKIGNFTGYELSADGEKENPQLTQAVREGFEALFDAPAYPYLFLQTSFELQELIYEEEAAFFSGTGDAGSAAKAVQSRTAIWLSEHE